MWLFFDSTAKEWESAGQTFGDAADSFNKALEKSVTNAQEMVNNVQMSLTTMDDSAKKLQKTMASGMVFESSKFREQIYESYQNVISVGGKFDDITKNIEELSKGMGKVNFLSTDLVKVLENGKEVSYGIADRMVILEKSTGMATGDAGKMVAEFTRLEMSQSKSIERMEKISKTARMSGLDSKKLLTDVQGLLGKVDSYGFKNNVEGLTKMVAQAQRLRTSVDEIGALTKSQELWDPEKAIELSSKLQMLGGTFSELTNPFELMNMSINDVGKLQEKMTDMAAQAFTINKKTGEIDIDPASKMKLKEQAELFGKTLDEYTKIGRQAFKSKQVIEEMNKTGFGEGLPQESKDLISSLAEIKGGKVTLDIPGFKTNDLEVAMKNSPLKLQEALETYQSKAAMSEKQIAEQGLGIQETVQRDVRIIRDNLIKNMRPEDREGILKNLKAGIDTFGDAGKKVSDSVGNVSGSIIEGLNKSLETKKVGLPSDVDLDKAKEQLKAQGGSATTKKSKESSESKKPELEKDAIFGEGNKILSTGKCELFNFIKEDQAIFAPDLSNKLSTLKNTYLDSMRLSEKINEVSLSKPNIPKFEVPKTETSKIESPKIESTQKIETSGDINININVKGDGTLSEMLSKDRSFNEDLKRKVLQLINSRDRFMSDKTVTQ